MHPNRSDFFDWRRFNLLISNLHHAYRFWDALAPHHAAIEENYLDRACLRRIMGDVQSRVLIVGAGQGLLVEELQSQGFECGGVDLSSEMISYAKSRRGLDLTQADASAIPLGDATYETIIYATGVIDFNDDESAIGRIFNEGRRVLKPGGKIFVGFYRLSPGLECFLERLGLLNKHVLRQRECLETYLLSPVQMIRWVEKHGRTRWLGAAALVFRWAVFGPVREKATTLKMQRIVRRMDDPQAFIQAAPQTQPYRNEAEIRRLFSRLAIRIKELRTFATCWIAQI
ncbi:MAG TPA: class I SAM-dependent methyltransferase [Verrucomicrobiae bacterium]|nr:class I SAM-dependent methyltransferase [Verrucomicrobiae bacterium]